MAEGLSDDDDGVRCQRDEGRRRSATPKRRQLFDAQDDVVKRRDALIEDIDKQLQIRTRIAAVFTLRWSLSQ